MENQDEQNLQEQNVQAHEVDESAAEPTEVSINEEKLDIFMEGLKAEQNLSLALFSGSIAALIGAILWALVTVNTGYQIGYMALAVGFLVGFSIRYTGNGLDQIFGISGAVLALVGCLLGNMLSIVGFIADAEGLGYIETLSLLNFGALPQIMIETFNPMDLLFYGIAIYEGYRFSFRQISEEEIILHATDATD